jgi:Fe2+ transport system protein FeoA|mmetsp:Transcript_83013/g.130957  ORF Transcript_83013/g.130957 Transcript_83013/m.130957 type:complete len:533 (+) Transcript_83013:70-1668(+)
MAGIASSSTRLLKVKLDGDIRRARVELPNGGSAADKLVVLRDAVAACFGTNVRDLPVLKYQDEDEDMCTLIEASLEDMLQLSGDGTLYLFASTNDVCESNEAEATETVVLVESDPAREETVLERSDDDKSLLAPLLEMGFSENEAITAVEKAHGDLETAVASLLKGSRPSWSSLLGRLVPKFSLAGVASYKTSALEKESAARQCFSNADDEVDPFLTTGTAVNDEVSEAADLPDQIRDHDEAVQKLNDESSLIAPLLEMGFSEEDAISTVSRTGGNLEAATASLLHGNQPRWRSLVERLLLTSGIGVDTEASHVNVCKSASVEPSETVNLQVIPSLKEAVLEKLDDDTSLIAPLLEMGFCEKDAISAVDKAAGNLEMAVASLLEGSDQSQQPSLLESSASPSSSASQKSDRPVSFEEKGRAGVLIDDVSIASGTRDNTNSNGVNSETISQSEAIESITMRHLEQIQENERIENPDGLVRITDQYQETSSTVTEVSMSEDAVANARCSINATPVDKAQVFVSRFLSAIRNRRA